MDHKREIIKDIERIAGKYSPYEVFTDWIRSAALSISNSLAMIHDNVYQDREQTYMDTVRKYTPDELRIICGLTGHLVMALEENMEDVLGDVYMKSGMGSKSAGQFFTPFHLSELTARLSILSSNLVKSEEMITLNEPTCGGGGMIIAACKVLKDQGINYQRRLDVVAQDLDWKGVYMTYLQLSLIGCRAIVVQGNTLSDPFDPTKTDRSRMLYTPAKMGALL